MLAKFLGRDGSDVAANTEVSLGLSGLVSQALPRLQVSKTLPSLKARRKTLSLSKG